MKANCTLRALGVVALFAALASAQDRQVVTLTDAGDAVPGRSIVRDLPGPAAGAPEAPAIGQMPGWPVIVGGHGTFAPSRGAIFADLDGDGLPEIVTSSTDSRIYAFDHTGAAMPGFPVMTIGYAQNAPSTADLDGDGDLEIVQFTRGLTSGGRVYVLDHLGSVLPGYPKIFGNNNIAGSPTLHDLDGDGQMELLVPERVYPTGLLHAIELDGTAWGGLWPVSLDHVPTGSPAVGDVDDDGEVEIAYYSYDSIYLLNLDGSSLPGWPKSIPSANFSYQSPAFFDMDGDGDLEIAVAAHKDAAGYYLYQHDGTLLPGWPKLVGTWTYCPPTVVDIEGDGALDVLGGRDGTGVTPSSVFWAWNMNGTTKPGFPYLSYGGYGGGCGGAITVVDIDGDGVREIFSDHNVMESGQGYVYGVDSAGQDLPGFPLRPIGFSYMNGPTFGDADADGDVELLVLSVDGLTVYINLYDLDGPWVPAEAPWGTYHQDNARGGLSGGGRKLHADGLFALATSPTVTLVGEPGAIASVGMSLSINHVPTPFGWKFLGPLRKRVINGVVIPPSGQLEVPFPIPNNPILVGTTFYFQGLSLLGGSGELTNLLGRTVQ